MYSNFNNEDHPKDDAPLSPVYQSEAARQIVQELSKKDQNDNIEQNESLTKRLVPREKRRHHTVTSVRPFSITEPYNVNSKNIIVYNVYILYIILHETIIYIYLKLILYNFREMVVGELEMMWIWNELLGPVLQMWFDLP